jgi:hypothetical protein
MSICIQLLEILQKATYKPHGFKLIWGTVCSAQALVMLVLGHHHAMNFFLSWGVHNVGDVNS